MRGAKVKTILAVLLIVAIAVPIFAYSQLQTSKQIPVVLVIKYPTAAQFGLYWDYECSNPVTSIDFGEYPKSTNWIYISKSMYLRNEQPGKRIWVFYNSTLRDATTMIGESWFSNGTSIDPGYVYYASYYLSIQPNIEIGTYNWVLGVWAIY